MVKPTYTELQEELTDKQNAEKNLKKRVGTLHEEVLRYKGYARSLPVQYERVIKEYKKQLEFFASNSWKLVFVIVSTKINAGWKKIKGE